MKFFKVLSIVIILVTGFSCDNEPLEGDFPDAEEIACFNAIQNTLVAATNFATAAANNNYTALCNVYITALQEQILACGDPDNALQLIIEDLGDCIITIDACANASIIAQTAETNFNNATTGDYSQLCNIYKTALDAKIIACGDQYGNIQNIIDGLGDCIQPVFVVEMSFTLGTQLVEFDIVNVVIEGSILKVTGETSLAGTHMIYYELQQGETGIDIINDTFVITINTQYIPSTQGLNDYTSTISNNSTGNINGTFSGVVTNSNGGNLNLTDGVINIDY